jgi:hypothetical protein
VGSAGHVILCAISSGMQQKLALLFYMSVHGLLANIFSRPWPTSSNCHTNLPEDTEESHSQSGCPVCCPRIQSRNPRREAGMIYIYIYCHVYESLSTGFLIGIGLIDHFNTQLVLKYTYGTITDFHTLSITVVHAKFFNLQCLY